MAEVIGTIASVVTLAALFKSCIEAFDIIQTAHNQELDIRKLVLKLNLEKCRLYTWGEAMGLMTDQEEQPVTATCPFQDILMETLEMLLQLFDDTERLQNLYGCKQFLDAPLGGDKSTRQVKHLAASFGDFKLKGKWRAKRLKMLSQARWAIHDRKKFMNFISDIKDFVDGLQNITRTVAPPSVQDNSINKRIESMDDMETLDMLSEVCQDDHPDIARIASDRAETISMTSTAHWKMERWDCPDDGSEADESIDLEALSITELRHYVFRMAKQRQELEIRLQWFQSVLLQPDSILSRSADLLTTHQKFRNLGFEVKQQLSHESQMNWTEPNARNSLPACENARITSGLRSSAAATQLIPFVASAKPPSALAQDLEASKPSMIKRVEDQHHFADTHETHPTGHVLNDLDECESITSTEIPHESQDRVKSPVIQDAPFAHCPSERSFWEEASCSQPHSSRISGQDLTNGFMNFTFLTNGANSTTQREDYFVLSFNIPRQVLPPALDACLGHSHYTDAQYIAKIANTKAYVPFDVRAWQRDLQISATVAAGSVDDVWAQALGLFEFQANIFAIPVQPLMVCRAPNGGCLRTLFDVLAQNKLFARCYPALIDRTTVTPEVYILPLGKSTFRPRFITHIAPEFEPTLDVLLLIMTFVKTGQKVTVPLSGEL